ncbi:MAG: TrkH family potassium uptake protein, partial [Nevskiales bacterium]
YQDGALSPFVEALALTFLIGFLLWLPVRHAEQDLRLREGCLVVVLFWLVFGLVGAFPLLLANEAWHSFTDAMFESVSGITTTGATTVTGLDDLPKALLYYRAQLQWIGGMGVIVLAVAVLPMLGVGGMQLYRAETPGPMKDSKLTPRITETARALWLVYAGVTALCVIGYWLAGMSLFDAICHAFATLSSGGFSTYDASLAHFDSAIIDVITIVFMVVAASNFSLHFLVWHRGSARVYLQDSEFRAYLGLMGTLVLVVSFTLFLGGTYASLFDALRFGGFQLVSLATSTGYTTADYTVWPGALPVLLIISSAVCSSAGSTGGGIKVIRVVLLAKFGYREILRIVHPSAEIPVKIGGRAVSNHVLAAVTGFFAVYIALFLLLWYVLMTLGLDAMTAFSAVSLSINNMGPGLGEIASNFTSVGPAVKWVCIFAMLVGRLELFTLLAVLTPAFWRR